VEKIFKTHTANTCQKKQRKNEKGDSQNIFDVKLLHKMKSVQIVNHQFTIPRKEEISISCNQG
jgi:hypothetical protein